MHYYNLETKEVVKSLNSNLSGLKEETIKQRLKKYGHNKIKKTRKISGLKIFLNQFKDFLILILIVALIISAIIPIYKKGINNLELKDLIDPIVILAILIMNAFLGFFQEYKAEKAIALLKKLSPEKTTVIRNNQIKEINSSKIVPGDIILLEEGDKISADARLIHVDYFKVDESTLTGESIPVTKITKPLRGKQQLAEQINMVFAGTMVVAGRAKAIVVNTGHKTEMGKIASLVQETQDTITPLQKRLQKLGEKLGIIVIAIAFLVFVIGVINKFDITQMFMAGLSLAVAVIPEGLPAVVTITLALGIRKMYKKNALIRRIKSIETLGSITIICADKTGTLTKNDMEAKTLFINNQLITTEKGKFYQNKKEIEPKKLSLLLDIAASCNNSTLHTGDPTEKALLKLAKTQHIEKRTILNQLPFNSERKYMITEHLINNKKILYLKGAPEKILNLCNYINIENREQILTNKTKSRILDINNSLASEALRVLAMAYKQGNKTIFVGLIGMMDPPKPEVKNALKLAKQAGIKVKMLTGDNIKTAEAIAKQIGIIGDAITGQDLDSLNEKELKNRIEKIAIFARIDPSHKVKILKALQDSGEIVAMSGDGVNDAPALKKADVGIAMGLKGTDISREVSDMVLTDDHFASIVAAIRQGRIIYDNIKKFLKFLLSVNFTEILVILFTLILKFPLPFLPLQILWINLVTDSLPALALGIDPAEKDIMKRKPRNPKESILYGIIPIIIFIATLAFISTLGIYFLEYYSGTPIDKVRTMTVTTSIVFELIIIFGLRTKRSLLKEGIFKNKWLFYAVIGILILQFLVVQTPINFIFKFVSLGLFDWIKIVLFSSFGIVALELAKKLTPKIM